MFEVHVGDKPFDVKVATTNNRGFTPEELADQAVEKIVSVSNDADPMVREQAHIFKGRIRNLLVQYMQQAAKSDRTTVRAALHSSGHSDLADMIWRL